MNIKENMMEIEKTKYSARWLENYIEAKKQVFTPLTDGCRNLNLNARLRRLSWLVIAVADLIVVRMASIHPAQASVCAGYIMFSVVCATVLISEGIKAAVYPFRKLYKRGNRTFNAAIEELELLKEGYVTIETLERSFEDNKGKDKKPSELFRAAGLEADENLDEIMKDGKVLDFSANDSNVDQYVDLISQLEENLKKAGIIGHGGDYGCHKGIAR